MAKYSQEFKLEVVHHYLSSNDGLKRTAKRYGVDHNNVKKWLFLYNEIGEAGLNSSSRYKRHSLDFKFKVIQSILNDGMSYSEALVKFKLNGTGMISHWLKQYKEHGIDGLKPKPRGRPNPMPKSQFSRIKVSQEDRNKTQEQLLEELAYLRAENAYLKKRRALIQKQKEQEKVELQRLQDSYLN
ncbi:helix-turn-helix domain-containing protein [Acinetobacter qingfengensis]|uniref:Transposase n=1 Tax=Acinetobacter qingfengensis TaxID=1262585 RepID=A0A1E7RD43_9GAMM|nr:helix-turn-helix domain-containing protein [Acinetobacter qingfengensis]OEY97196.1 transposase [Acinetobacter qingfengensis]